MFRLLISLAALALTLGITAFGYWQARKFTTNRLRFVDAVHRPIAPVIAGIGAALVAIPLAAFLPLIGTGTALLFGAAVATGVASGAREIRRRIGA